MTRVSGAAGRTASTSQRDSATHAVSPASGLVRKPALSEAQFQRQVTDLAVLSGWEWAHFRKAQTPTGWRTPTAGTIGTGFPDLVLVHRSQARLLFVEVKSDKGRLRPDQSRVLSLLYQLVEGPTREWAEVHVWHPKDWATIEATLTHKEDSRAA